MKKQVILFGVTAVAGMLAMTMPVNAAKKAKGTGFSLTPSIVTPTNRNVSVAVKLNKGSKIKEIKWRAGKVTKSANKYWKKAKKITKPRKFSASSNGWYSVRVKNKKNKYTIRNISVNCIDRHLPDVQSGYTVSNKVATVTASASDANGISYMGFAKGYLNNTNPAVYTALDIAAPTFQAAEPGYYTICVKDGVGNTTLHYQYVELWKNLWDITPFDSSCAENYEGTKTDRWDNVVTNPILVEANDRGNRYIEYYLGGEYSKLSGNIVRSKELKDDEITWVQIYADGVKIYESPKMDYKTKAIPFDIEISHAKYIKIMAVSTGDIWGSHDMMITDAQVYN